MNLFCRMLAMYALVGGFVVGPSGSVYAVDVTSLPGYKAYSTLSSFKAFLKENPEVYQHLQNDPALAEEVLGNTSRQREMMQEAAEQAPESYTVEAEKPADTLTRDEQATQAANEAIIRALAEKEAAKRRAEGTLRLITQQEALINQARAEAELAANEAKMENIKAAFDGHPEKQAQFFANTALLQKVMDDRLSLQEALAEAGITLEQTPEPELTETPGPETIEYPEDQLVHVYGNKYRLGDKELYDLNHVPSEEEMALDDNGWPKFLNVPAECGPANPDVTYFFEDRVHQYSSGGGQNFQTVSQMNYHGPAPVPDILSDVSTIGLTDSEQLVVPFYTFRDRAGFFKKHGRGSFAVIPDMHSLTTSAAMTISISHCPADWSGTTPQGKKRLHEKCSLSPSELWESSGYFNLTITDEQAPVENESLVKNHSCHLEPGKRYFINISPPHLVDPDRMSNTESKVAHLEWVDGDVDGYLNNPCRGAGCRNGERIHTSGITQTGAAIDSYIRQAKKTMGIPPKQTKNDGFVGQPEIHTSGRFYKLAGARPSPRHVQGAINFYKRTGPRNCTTAGENIRDHICYDPYGILPPVKYTLTCTGPNAATWTRGYDAKIFAHLVCEDRTSKHYGDACHQGRELAVRAKALRNTGHTKSYRRIYKSTRALEQCQFNLEKGRFEWVTIEANKSKETFEGQRLRTPGPQSITMEYTGNIAQLGQCEVNGKKLDIGEQVELTSRLKGLKPVTLNCKQLAEKPAAPALVNKNGYSLNRMVPGYNLWPEYEVKHIE